MKKYSNIIVPLSIFTLSRVLIYVLVWLLGMYGFGAGAHLVRWDAEAYSIIAQQGYQFNGSYIDGGFFIAFFPLLPILISGAMSVFEISAATAGLSISFVFGLVSAVLLYKVLEKWRGRDVAQIGVTLFSFYPTTVFMSAPYTESLFLCLVLGLILSLDAEKYKTATALLALSFVTRVTGSVLGIYYLVRMWKQKVPKLKLLLFSFLSSLPFIAFLFLQYKKFGTPFAFLIAQREYWKHEFVLPWQGFFEFISDVFLSTIDRPMLYQDFVLFSLVILTFFLSWKRIPRHIWFFGIGIVTLTLLHDGVRGMGRYLMLVLPIYYYWAEVLAAKKYLYPYVLAVLGFWMCLDTIVFALRSVIF